MQAVSYSLRQTVFGILKTLLVHARQNNFDLTYDVEPDIPDQLIGDSLFVSDKSLQTWLIMRSSSHHRKHRVKVMSLSAPVFLLLMIRALRWNSM